MTFSRMIAAVLLLVSISFNSHAQNNDYDKLTLQEKADLARYLGWVWGDGKPGADGTGILYKGGNSNYSDTVRRLANIRFDGTTNPFGFPESGNLKLTRVWDYWENSLPGGNPGDPQILREAIKHPNFLAGIIEGEGQGFHNENQSDFYIADQSYAPSHPDKIYDIANFGPERMVQLFLLLEETYGFTNPAMSIGNKKYQFNTQRCEAIEKLRSDWAERKQQNENGNLKSGFGVRVFVKEPNFDEIRSYGYFRKNRGDYRTPAPDRNLNIINSSLPDQNAEVSGTTSFFGSGSNGTRLLHGSGAYLNSDLAIGNSGNLNWELIDLNNGYYRIESQDSSKSKNSIQAQRNTVIKLVGDNVTGHWTQWEKIQVPNAAAGTFYLKNRFHGTHLRVASNGSVLKHGPFGQAARWTLEEGSNNTCR